MDNQNTDQSLFDLNLTETVKTELKGAAVWGGIAALLTIISSALSLISAFMQRNNPVAEYKLEGFEKPTIEAANTGNMFSVIVGLCVNILLFYFLYRFANLTKAGLAGNDQDRVSDGLGSLSTYFIIIGIIIILVLVIVLLAVAGLAAGAGR